MSQIINLNFESSLNIINSSSNVNFKNGVEISDISSLRDSIGFKLRSHSKTIRTIGGRDISDNIFNDTDSLDSLFGGLKKSHVVLSTEGKYSERITHEQIITNFGQKDLYEKNIFFSDNQELRNPINYFQSNKSFLKQSEDTSNFSSKEGWHEVLTLNFCIIIRLPVPNSSPPFRKLSLLNHNTSNIT